MSKSSLPVRGHVTFEGIKKTNDHGAEYWSARDLQPLLGYSQWRRFEEAVKRAMASCEQSGNMPQNHFGGAARMVARGGGSAGNLEDKHHSRRAT